MKQKHPLRYATVMRLVRSIHANAARLFLDACTLYREASYPSAYALSILAYEELGKMEMVDHVAFEEVLNGSARMTRERMEHLFSRKMYYSHRNKQAWAFNPKSKKSLAPYSENRMFAGRLESDKQNALYVGFTAGRIRYPLKFTARHAHRQLRYTLQVFLDVRDMPFYDIREESNSVTRRRADKITHHLKEAFSKCQVL